MRVTGIDKEVEPLLLPGAMAVLSLGRLVTEHGYDFVWRKGRSPYLLSPEGKKLKLKVRNNCPYLCEEGSEGSAFPSREMVSAGVEEPEQAGQPAVPALEDAGQPAVQRQEQGPGQLAEAQQRERDLTLRQQATSMMHLLTHLPKNPHCETCQRAKMRNKQTPDRSKRPSDLPSQEAKAFGEKLTADHTFARSINDCGMGGEEVILVVRDIFTKWIEAYPLKSKDTSKALRALRDYMGAAKGESFHSDDSPELKAAA